MSAADSLFHCFLAGRETSRKEALRDLEHLLTPAALIQSLQAKRVTLTFRADPRAANPSISVFAEGNGRTACVKFLPRGNIARVTRSAGDKESCTTEEFAFNRSDEDLRGGVHLAVSFVLGT